MLLKRRQEQECHLDELSGNGGSWVTSVLENLA